MAVDLATRRRSATGHTYAITQTAAGGWLVVRFLGEGWTVVGHGQQPGPRPDKLSFIDELLERDYDRHRGK